MSGKLIVVAGAQYGSEGKGAVADHLTQPVAAGSNVVAVRVAGPNAGHTVYGRCPEDCGFVFHGLTLEDASADSDHVFNGAWIGHPWRLRSVPVSAVGNPNADLVIAAGSEIDRSVLMSEVTALDSAGYGVSDRLRIDAQATILEPEHINEEVVDGIQARLGSTAKGIGAARAERIWRRATLWGWDQSPEHQDNTADFLRDRLKQDAIVMIEGTQGYGLGLHAGNYPKCTSSDCRAVDFLAMAGLSPWHPSVGSFEVWLVARVRPIRVAGNSGPMKGETTWDELGLPEEYTTVTKKVRRVGEWDGDLVAKAVEENGGHPFVKLAVTMADTVFPRLARRHGDYRDLTNEGDLASDVDRWIKGIEEETRAEVRFIGTGPTTGLWR